LTLRQQEMVRDPDLDHPDPKIRYRANQFAMIKKQKEKQKIKQHFDSVLENQLQYELNNKTIVNANILKVKANQPSSRNLEQQRMLS